MVEDQLGKDQRDDDTRISETASSDKDRREALTKIARWVAPTIVALTLSSRASATSQNQPQPPGGF